MCNKIKTNDVINGPNWTPKLCTKFEVDTLSHSVNIKGNLKYLEASLANGHALFSSEWDFMMGLGKPHESANFEVDNFSRCRNIKGEPPILGSSPSPGPPPVLLWVWWRRCNAENENNFILSEVFCRITAYSYKENFANLHSKY